MTKIHDPYGEAPKDRDASLAASYHAEESALGLTLSDYSEAKGPEALRHLRSALARCSELQREKNNLATKYEETLEKDHSVQRRLALAVDRLRTARALLQQAPARSRLRSLAQIVGSLLVGLSPAAFQANGDPPSRSAAVIPWALLAGGVALVAVSFVKTDDPNQVIPEDEDADE